jgi:catechol 2,3-dioxygenase-like lactoylglutathione lyase family enzyme/DNA-binding CsgD family transcriptional regulator
MARRGRPAHPDILTPAEWGVLDSLRHGMSNAVIARERQTSLDAVKFHLDNIRGKLHAHRAALKHWTGIPRGSVLRRRKMANTMEQVKLGAIGQVAVVVKDISRAEAFYRDVLGMTHMYTFGQLAFFDCGGTRLFLDALPEAQRNGTSVIYYRVPDIHAAHAGLQAKGVIFEGAPHMIFEHEDGTEEWMAFFRDPDENLLALMSQVKP